MMHFRSERQPKAPETTERTTQDGRMIKDPVTVIRSDRAREHFRQIDNLVKSGKIVIEKKKK